MTLRFRSCIVFVLYRYWSDLAIKNNKGSFVVRHESGNFDTIIMVIVLRLNIDKGCISGVKLDSFLNKNLEKN